MCASPAGCAPMSTRRWRPDPPRGRRDRRHRRGGLFGIVLAMVRSHRGFASFDTSAARFGAHHATHTSTQVLRTVTQAGGAYVIVPLAVVVGIVEAPPPALLGHCGLPGRRRRWAVPARRRDQGHRRPRPPEPAEADRVLGSVVPVRARDGRRRDLRRVRVAPGPGRSPRAKALLAALAVGAAVLISATRVMLGVHWLTDVVAGLLLGWTWFVIYVDRIRWASAPLRRPRWPLPNGSRTRSPRPTTVPQLTARGGEVRRPIRMTDGGCMHGGSAG